MRGYDGLVGREHALAAGHTVMAEALAGRGQLLLVTGEPGIGKTALAGQLLREMPGARAQTVWASCRHGEGTPAYWPWVQVLRAVFRSQTGAGAVVALGDAASLLPEQAAAVRADTGGAGTDHAGAAEAARFRLFDALAHVLVRVAADHPLVVVLDDLHWSDEPSLLALRFVADQIRTAPVMLLGTYRETEAGATLFDLARSARVLQLPGLAEGDVASLMEVVVGSPPAPMEAREVWRRTGGNPFFVREVARLFHPPFAAPGGPVEQVQALPESVRETLRCQLLLLSPRCAEALAAAAVIGREFAVHVLARAMRAPADELVEPLQEAARCRVLTWAASPPGHYRFVHDLFRETVYDELGATRRAELHLTVARTLEALQAGGEPIPVAELAWHFCQAAAAGGAAEAVEYARLAAREAAAGLAFEDACVHYERALGALPLMTAADARIRLGLLLEVADVRYRCGRTESARVAFLGAADIARAHGAADDLARAAIGLHLLGVRSGDADRRTLALLEESAAQLGDEQSLARARVLAALARDLHHSLEDAATRRAGALAEEAVSIARALGDPGTLATCMLALHDARWSPGTAEARLPMLEEMAELAVAAGDREMFAQARLLWATALLELGHPKGRRALDDYCRLADELGHARARWGASTRRATIAMLGGRLAEAEQLIDSAASLGERIGEPDARSVAAIQTWALSRFGQGHLEHLDRAEVDDRVGHPSFIAVQMLARGDRASAAAALAGYSVDELPWSHDPEPLVHLAAAAAEVGTPGQRRSTYGRLAPLAGTSAVVGGCAAYLGAVDDFLGALAENLGWRAAATAHYETALAIYDRLGASAYADLVRARMRRLLPAATISYPNLFRRDETGWTLSHAGTTVQLPDSKGLRDIAALLGAAGREIHVHELLGVQIRSSGADPMLDAKAREAYRARLTALNQDILDAEADNDGERAAQARAERDFLIQELSAAAGLGGRTRLLGDETERLRKTVTARIRKAIARVERVHPDLARHLTDSLRTGTRCGYFPAEPMTWNLGAPPANEDP